MKNLFFMKLRFLVILISLTSICYSQKTGIFEESIIFLESARNVSFYVPTDYNPDSTYHLMICLHGLGDNSTNFRNALINSLGWNNMLPKTIFACPDGGSDQNSDFYLPEGDEEIIQVTSEFVLRNYKVDSTNIILEGFSLGGRSALKYGLDYPEKFYGLLLNTPAVQGAEDAYNNPQAGLIYNYKNASKIKIAITHGSEDYTYLSPDAIVYDSLISNDGIVMKKLVQNMGHNIPSRYYIEDCLNFLENPTEKFFAIELTNVTIPKRTCQSRITPSCMIRYLAKDSLTSLDLIYKINGEQSSHTWTGNIKSFQHAVFDLPEIQLKEGENTLFVALNITVVDTVVGKFSSTINCQRIVKGEQMPLTEGFNETDFPTNNWILNESGNIFTWMTDDAAYTDGSQSLFMVNTILIFYNRGSHEDLLTPALDLTSISNPAILFDYAYNYHKFNTQYFTQDTYFADTLEISISTDCGKTYERLFKKGGAELATTSEPILNPIQILQCQFIPAPNEWKKLFFDLSKYANSDNAIVRLSYISDLGGSINIDNFRILDGSTVGIENSNSTDNILVYPNPAINSTNVYYSLNEPAYVNISLYNTLGIKISEVINSFEGEGSKSERISTKNLIPGVYFIKIELQDKNIIKKLIIE